MKDVEQNFDPYDIDELPTIYKPEDINPDDLVFIMPTFSIPNIQVKKDMEFLKKMFFLLEEHVDRMSDEIGQEKANIEKQKIMINLISGYPAFPDFFYQNLFNQNLNMKIIGASPFANSFFDAGFVKGRIPKIYRERLKNVKKLFDQNKLKDPKLQQKIYEWEKLNWTFHAKHLNMNFGDNGWYLSTIGSSNFSRRSLEKDIECNMFIFSRSSGFRTKLEDEQKNIEEHLVELDDKRVNQKFMKYGLLDNFFDLFFSEYL